MTTASWMRSGRRAGACHALIVAAAALWVVVASPLCLAQPAREGPMHAWAAGRIEEILAAADSEEMPDLERLEADLSAVFDALIAYGDERRPEVWIEAAKWHRLARFVGQTQTRYRIAFWRTLRENPVFAGHLAFALCEKDDASGMSRVVVRLPEVAASVKAEEPSKRGVRRPRGEAVEEVGPLDDVASLAAAICVVHDERLVRRVNENSAAAPDPAALFRHYLKHERQLVFNFRQMPVDVLVYMVDATGSMEEIEWAFRKHQGERRIGNTYDTIVYDHRHVNQGTEKKITEVGFTLPNIARYGGICADQAYYASTCGKAIGVPTAYVSARSAVMAHAWVGFVEGRETRAAWNFEFGRYDPYEGVKGNVIDPQSGEPTSDGDLAFLVESAAEAVEERWAAAALTDAAERLLELESSRAAYPPPYPLEVETSRDLPRTRPAALADALDLIETGLRVTPGYRRGWEVVRGLASEGRLNYEQKQRWAQALDRLTGSKYPDFTLNILRPMIETVEDARRQHELWERAQAICKGRADLLAEIRLAQGRLWETQDEKSKAWACYEDVVRRYLNEGPSAVDALAAMERLLRVNGKSDRITPLYEEAWRRVSPPGQGAEQFRVQSNFYRIGAHLANLLEASGRLNTASTVRKRIGWVKKAEAGG